MSEYKIIAKNLPGQRILAISAQVDEAGELHITGVTGHRRSIAAGNGDSCGQITTALRHVPADKLLIPVHVRNELADIWKRYHLNHMKAGTPAQEEFLRANPVHATYPESHYVKALNALAAAGLSPDPAADGYVYGSAWLKEELPQHVRRFVQEFNELPLDTIRF